MCRTFSARGLLQLFIPAGRLGVRQPTVTGPVIALERKCLVRRQADPADARVTTAKFTPRPSRNRLLPFPSLTPPLWRI
jgi:hypothetical protein